MLRVSGELPLIGLKQVVSCQQETECFPLNKLCHEFLQRITRCHKLCIGVMVGGLTLFIYSFCREKSYLRAENLILI